MKVFRVVTERDGHTVKAPGISETEVRREEWRFAADSFQQVWEHIGFLRNDLECAIIAIHEEHPSITVLPSPSAGEGKE